MFYKNFCIYPGAYTSGFKCYYTVMPSGIKKIPVMCVWTCERHG